MAMIDDVAAPLDDAERADIEAQIRAGQSRNEIARDTGRAGDTISRIAEAIGHTFGQSNLARAHEARSSYAAGRRAEVAALAVRRAVEVLEGFDAGQEVVVSTKDGAFPVEVRVDARGQKDRAQAAQLLMRTVLDIDRHDARADEGASKGLLARIFDGLHEVAPTNDEETT